MLRGMRAVYFFGFGARIRIILFPSRRGICSTLAHSSKSVAKRSTYAKITHKSKSQPASNAANAANQQSLF